jgi:ATP-dependent DNA helicase RecG
VDIKFLKGVGEKRAAAFKEIGINSLEDFLQFIPRMYIEKVDIKNIRQHFDSNVLIAGKVYDIDYPKKPNHPLNVIIRDDTGITQVPIFGKSEFRSKQFRLNDFFIFWGKVSEGFYNVKYQLDYRDHLKISSLDKNEIAFLKFRYLPIYELSGVLKKTWIRPLLLSKIVFNAFHSLLQVNPKLVEESLPDYVIKKSNLISRKEAILRINFPLQLSEIEIARKRLAYEELFYLQLLMALKKRMVQTEAKGIEFHNDIKELTKNFKSTLKFELTGAQKKVMNEIYLDMKSNKVMNRLLQGDVGSGKTIVSIYALLIAVENGYQSALMCPTELLAEQHYITISNFINDFNKISGK